MKIIDSKDTGNWQAVLNRCISYDFYHLATCHEMEVALGGYQVVLFVYEEDEAVVALPLILQPLAELDGLSDSFAGYYDATSVYGYAGPVTNRTWADRAFFLRFGCVLRGILHERNIIAAFSRLHPIIQNEAALLGIGEVVPLGETVSMDLTLPVDEQFRLFRKSHRYEIRKAQKDGFIAFHDKTWEYYDDFVALYIATMKRVNADQQYFFERVYFDELRTALGENLHLFVVKQNNKVISAALFTLVNGIVQYHLSGSSTDSMNYAASKLVIDKARLWASEQGASVFHLGGGFGSQEDSLFLFKSGFSNRRHQFNVWRYVVDSERYNEAIRQRREWLLHRDAQFGQESFFPLYRSEHVPKESA